jgi:DNA repair exonuclease SbcCD ATPase subunit
MRVDEFNRKKQEIENQMENLKDALRSLERQHIEESELYKSFDKGDFVDVITPAHKAYKLPSFEEVIVARKIQKGVVKGFCINIDGIVHITLNKIKKDGSESCKPLFYNTTNTIIKKIKKKI